MKTRISTATALQMEETPTTTPATAKPTKPTNPISAVFAKLKASTRATSRINLFHISQVCKAIGKAFVTCIIFYCLGIYFPELREMVPGFYRLVDLFLTGADACFGALADLLQWPFTFLQ